MACSGVSEPLTGRTQGEPRRLRVANGAASWKAWKHSAESGIADDVVQPEGDTWQRKKVVEWRRRARVARESCGEGDILACVGAWESGRRVAGG